MIPPVSNSRNSGQAARTISLSAPLSARSKLGLPPFSSFPLLFLVAAKPLTDAFYEVEALKYGYMVLLALAALLARFGLESQGREADSRNKPLFAYVYLIVLYFCFQYALAMTYGGSLSTIFKVVSPCVFFVLMAYAADRWLIYALATGAVLTIAINAALLPFDFGWIWWGSVKTFKGYYFFKTDLAYSLCFAVLLYAYYARNRITPALAVLTLMASAQVILANSRLNYLSFLLVVLFIALKGGINLRSMFRISLLLGVLALAVAFLYDPAKLLGFDVTNKEAFTQGRSVTWSHLLIALGDFSPIEWLFGRGQFADVILSAEINRAWKIPDNAHNEFLHLLYTQGIAGLAFYIILWLKMFQMSHSPGMPQWARGTVAMALLLFLLQGMTSVVSSFATKTWPVVMVLLAVRGLGNAEGPLKQAVRSS